MSETVFIAPGHGRTPNGNIDPGAATADGSKTEQSEGDIICGHVVDMLADRYSGVKMVRQAKGGPNFVETITFINKHGFSVSVEVHHDWRRAPVGGFGFHTNDEQRALANAIHRAYKELGLPTRPHMETLPGRDVPPSISTRTEHTTVLWETTRIGEVDDYERYAKAIVLGIGSYLGLEPRPARPPEQDDGDDDRDERDQPRRYLTYGDRGDDVRSWQKDLIRLLGPGAIPAGATGNFLGQTVNATVRFYDRVGLSPADRSRPRVGRLSREKMEEALKNDSWSWRYSETLRRGSMGQAVDEWQRAVIRLLGPEAIPGYFNQTGGAGSFGPQTVEATRRAFQALGLVRVPAPDPVVGPRSRAAMGRALNR